MEEVARDSEENYLERREFITKELNGESSCELSHPRREPTEESLHAANKRHEEQSFRGPAG